jgi:hypothetical protein
MINDKFTKDAVIPSQVSGLLLLFIESSLYFKVEKLKQISSTDSFKVEVEVVEIVTYATAKYLPLAVK